MSKGKILVTGGCGYIGSHTIVDLLDQGYEVVSVDNLVNSQENILDGIEAITKQRVINHQINLAERAPILALFEQEKFTGVIHFAALKSVGESVNQPLQYFNNNLNSLINIVEAMELTGCHHLIFSSSCSVYGNAQELPVTETTPRQAAESPYARTKQMGEDILEDYCRVHPAFKSVILRYFNPAGAHPSAKIGEAPSSPASNLVPVITETAIGKRDQMMVYGSDYPTRDGSAVRDYIHIMDLARAHTLALDYLEKNQEETNLEYFNLGIGSGVTVLEAIKAFEKVADRSLNYVIGDRRPGDVIAIYANYDLAAARLGWQPQYDIEDIMKSAWAWEQQRN